VRYRVINGNAGTEADEADVAVFVTITDVRTNPAGLDYTGRVLVRHELTVTDQSNSAEAPDPGTTIPFTFQYPVQCTSTLSTTIGGQCDLSTTAETTFANRAASKTVR
jgi:hypothetical protein